MARKTLRFPPSPDVAGNIRRIRRRQQLTQQEVAGALGIELDEYRGYEKGRRRIRPVLLARLARLLNTPVSAFFRDHTTPAPRRPLLSVPHGLVLAPLLSTPPSRR